MCGRRRGRNADCCEIGGGSIGGRDNRGIFNARRRALLTRYVALLIICAASGYTVGFLARVL